MRVIFFQRAPDREIGSRKFWDRNRILAGAGMVACRLNLNKLYIALIPACIGWKTLFIGAKSCWPVRTSPMNVVDAGG